MAPLEMNIFTFYPISTTISANLVISPNTLAAGTSYVFQLVYNSHNGHDFRSASVTITTNDIPRSGIFSVSPHSGEELKDKFFLSASQWADDQVPLLYRFGHFAESGDAVTLKAKNEDSSVEAVLPRGHALTENASLTLDCFLEVYDKLGAYAIRSQRVVVNASALNTSELDSLYDLLANETESNEEDAAIEEVRDVLVPVVVIVTNCSAAPACESLNRNPCSDVEHTCGACFAGNYLGEAGHANTFCYNNTISEDGVDHCFQDASCGSFRECVAYTCIRISQPCSATCLLNGECAYRNDTTGLAMDGCFVDDVGCSPVCDCDSGFNGPECDIPDAELEESVNLVEDIMCQYAADVRAVVDSQDEVLSSDLDAWSTLLLNVINEPFRLSIPSAVCSAALMRGMLNLTNSNGELSLDAQIMQLVLDGVETVLRFELFHAPDLQTSTSQSHLLRNASVLLLSYCRVVTDINATLSVLGQPSYSSTQESLEVAAVVLPPLGPDEVMLSEVTVPHGELYLHFRTVFGGPYCVVSYGAATFSDRMTEMLSMEALYTLSVNVTGKNSSAMTVTPQEEHFVVDLSPPMAPVYREIVNTFNISCLGDGNTTTVPCQNYTQYEVRCSADAGAWNFYCPPDSSMNLTCDRVVSPLPHDFSRQYSEACEVDYSQNGSVACVCIKILPVVYGDQEVGVDFEAVFAFVLADFVDTLWSVQSVSRREARDGAKNLLLLLVVIAFLCAVLLYVDHVAARQAREALVGRKRSQLVPRIITQADIEKDDFVSRFSDAEGMFPEMYRDDAFYQLFITEIKQAHRWISLCFQYDVVYPRHMKFLFLLSVVNCVLFFNSLVFNWVRLDAAVCGQFETVSSCLSEPSKLASGGPMCFWDEEKVSASASNSTLSSYCYPSRPSSSGELVLATAVISGLLSLPVILLLEVIVVHVLCRPVLTPSQVVPTSLMGENLSEDIGWGSSGVGKRGLCGKKRTSAVGVEKREGLLREVSMDVRQLVFDLQQYRSKLKLRELPDFDARWGFTAADIEHFLTEIEHLLSLQVAGAENEVAVSGQGLAVDMAAWFSSFAEDPVVPRLKSKGFRRLWSDVLEVHLKAEAEIAHIDTIPLNDLKGDRMLLLFKYDLLQGILSEVMAKLYLPRLVSRTSAALHRVYLRLRIPVSQGLRNLGCVLLLVLNGFFLLYMFLFSLRQQDAGYRRDWMKGFLVWLALEVALLSTLSMVVAQVVPAVLAVKGLKEMRELFLSAVTGVFADGNQVAPLPVPSVGTRERRNSAGEVVRDSERPLTVQPVVACEDPFNTSPYFFVSRKVAKAFPELIESKVVEQFRSVVPNKPYSRLQAGMRSERVRLRWAACVQVGSAVVMYCFLAVVAAIPELEYYLTSVIGWLMLGFLSHAGGITVLGVHIKFSGNFFLVFVILFYVVLFVAGRNILLLMQKEYKVGRQALMSKEEVKARMRKAKLVNAAHRVGKSKLSNMKKRKLSTVAPADVTTEGACKEGKEAAEKKDVQKDEEKSEVEVEEEEDKEEETDEYKTLPGAGARLQFRGDIFAMLNEPASFDDEEGDDSNSSGDRDSSEDYDRGTTRGTVSVGPESNKRNISRNSQVRMLKSLIASDSDSDSDGFGGSGEANTSEDKLDAGDAVTFLRGQGVRMASPDHALTVAEAVLSRMKSRRKVRPLVDSSDSDSDLDTERFTQAAVLEAFSFLKAKGVTIDDGADTSLYVTVANAMKRPPCKKV